MDRRPDRGVDDAAQHRIGATIVALGLTLALFIHHISDPLTLSF